MRDCAAEKSAIFGPSEQRMSIGFRGPEPAETGGGGMNYEYVLDGLQCRNALKTGGLRARRAQRGIYFGFMYPNTWLPIILAPSSLADQEGVALDGL